VLYLHGGYAIYDFFQLYVLSRKLNCNDEFKYIQRFVKRVYDTNKWQMHNTPLCRWLFFLVFQLKTCSYSADDVVWDEE